MTRRGRARKPSPAPTLSGTRNLVRVAPYRATWLCDCGERGTVYFRCPVSVGSVWGGGTLRCSACARQYRGMLITDPSGNVR